MDRRSFIAIFARHPVAANLLMIMMLLSGAFALARLNTQFFPTFSVDVVSVSVVWIGASAEDVAEAVTSPIEDELRDLDGLKEMTSTSAEGLSLVTLEFEEGTDMSTATDNAKERVARLRNLPETAEDPKITRYIHYEPIARVLVSGEVARDELRALARELERSLLSAGVAKVELTGLSEQEIAIEVPQAALDELGLSFEELGGRIAAQSRDLPAGEVGQGGVARQLRSLEQRERVSSFERLPVQIDRQGNVAELGDIAAVELRPREDQVSLYHEGQPAIELLLLRGESEDALEAAQVLEGWLAQTRPKLPPKVELTVYDERWQYIQDRISLLLKNGASGLLLVVAVLFLFLNGRVAFWVMIGIPVSFMAALGVLYLYGGSINMISLFGLIMTLGIIVDDAIVVGEDALSHYEGGEAALTASEGGAHRMLAPVMSSSLTTIAAFLPLMAIGGIIGNILFDIPLVVICVILASLVESFLVLPAHLRSSFVKMQGQRAARYRDWLDSRFNAFRDGAFRRAVAAAIKHRWTTITLSVGLLIAVLGLLAGGRLPFTFFPKVEGNTLFANVAFVPGTPAEEVSAFLTQLETALDEAETALGGDLVVTRVSRQGASFSEDPRQIRRAEHLGAVVVELISPDAREVRNAELIAAWRERVRLPPGLETLVVREPTAGPPGNDIDIQLTGAPVDQLKEAAERLKTRLESVPGVSAIADDLPYGQEQLIYSLTPEARALGLTVESVGRQLRSAYSGALVQIFQQGADEIEVRLMLPERERATLASLQDFMIRLPGGGAAPLRSVVELEARRGFETLRHAMGELAVRVTADVNAQVNNANRILDALEAEVLPELREQYGLKTAFKGVAEDQAETLADMQQGLLLALALIYLILAWVFGSYGWPLVVMFIIPMGLIGAALGHYLLGLDLTILSLFGLFGLTGIVVNDSIILVTFFKQLKAQGRPVREALVDAARLRLRAVLLTSLTTIGGLLPLLFETSLQAQFLIPMAVSISFGLAGATLLVLFVVPALLSVHESVAHRLKGKTT